MNTFVSRTARRFGDSAKAALTILLTLLILSGNLPAQTGSASIRGAISDPKGQPIAGAAITLVNTETNATRKQTTSEKGTYLFDLIAPGPYRLPAETPAFQKRGPARMHAPVDFAAAAQVLTENSSLAP